MAKFYKVQTLVLGAGITGLSIGASADVCIVERESSAGGICSQYQQDGFQFQNGGGHWIFGQEVRHFLASMTPMAQCVKKSSIFIDGKKIPYPIQNHLYELYGPEKAALVLAEIEGNLGTLRSLDESATMADYLRCAFGQTLYEDFFSPFHALYTAQQYRKVAPIDRYKTPFDIDAIREGVKPPAQRTPKPVASYNATFRYPRDGLQALTAALLKRCTGPVHFNTNVVRIDTQRKRVYTTDDTVYEYQHLVSTLPLNVTLELAQIDIKASPPYVSTLVLNIGAKKGPGCPDDHWLYLPTSQSGFHRIGIYSNVDDSFTSQKDTVALYIERSITGGQKLTAQELEIYKEAVLQELAHMGYITDMASAVVSTDWIPVAYTTQQPQSNWVQKSIAMLKKAKVMMVGRYATWSFQGIAKSMLDGLSAGILLDPDHALTHLDSFTFLEACANIPQLSSELTQALKALNEPEKLQQIIDICGLQAANLLYQAIIKAVRTFKKQLSILREHALRLDLKITALTDHGKKVDYEKPCEKLNANINYEIFIQDGIFVTIDNIALLSTKPASTEGLHTTFDQDRAIYVVTKSGKIFIGSAQTDKPPYFYHSSFTDEDIVMAGLIEIQDGKITYIDNCSGHFQPPKASLFSFVETLKAHKLLDDSAIIGYVWERTPEKVGKTGLRIVTQPVEKFLKATEATPLDTVVVWVNFDGITSEECGAGRFTLNNLSALDSHNSKHSKRLRPVIVGPNYSPEKHKVAYSDALHTRHDKLCQRYDGHLLLTDVPGITGSTSTLWESGVNGWRQLCQQSACDIHTQMKRLEPDPTIDNIIFIINDTNYAQLVIELDLLMQKEPIRLAITVYWVPHSTSISISGRNDRGEPNDPARFLWEQAVARYKPKCDNICYFISPIGEHMRAHLVEEYGVHEGRFAGFKSGIIRDPYLIQPTQKAVNAKLLENGIPADKDLIFCMGMSLAIKGHDLAIRAFASIAAENPNAHLVLLAPDRSSREPDYASLLQELITKHSLKKRVTWIKVFKDDLAPYIYRHPLTRVTLLPVRESPQDLIPMEARVAPTSSVLVVSNRGSNVYQVNHGADGFIADIGPPGEESIEDLARMLQTALTMDIVSRKKIVAAGKAKVAKDYDAERNFAVNFIYSPAQRLALDFYRNGLFSFEGTVLTHGHNAAVYVDCRLLASHPPLNQAVTALYQDTLSTLSFDHLCGVPLSALPITAIVAANMNKSALMVRSQQKEHGKKKAVEGDYTAGQTVVIIEDVITTGGSVLEKAVIPLERQGLIVSDIVVLFDAGKGGVQNLEQLGFNVHVIFPYCDFLQQLSLTEEPSSQQQAAIAAMIEDSKIKLPISPRIISGYSDQHEIQSRSRTTSTRRCGHFAVQDPAAQQPECFAMQDDPQATHHKDNIKIGSKALPLSTRTTTLP